MKTFGNEGGERLNEDDLVELLKLTFGQKVLHVMAEGIRRYYEELLVVGFSSEQALIILCASKLGVTES
jgi:hypothetical protein